MRSSSLVDCGDAAGLAEEVIVGASLLHHILDELALPVVGGEDGDLEGWVAEEAHVLVDCNHVLRLSEVLVEEGRRGCLSMPLDGGNKGRRGRGERDRQARGTETA